MLCTLVSDFLFCFCCILFPNFEKAYGITQLSVNMMLAIAIPLTNSIQIVISTYPQRMHSIIL